MPDLLGIMWGENAQDEQCNGRDRRGQKASSHPYPDLLFVLLVLAFAEVGILIANPVLDHGVNARGLGARFCEHGPVADGVADPIEFSAMFPQVKIGNEIAESG